VTRRLLRSPVAVVAGAYLALLILAVLAAPLTAPDNPGTQNLTTVLSGPGAAHWLGTDALGRDIISRLLFGGRAALTDVATALVAFWLTGIPLGILAGYRGGWLDRLVMRLADLLFAVPAIVVLLMVVAVYPGNEAATMITLGIVSAPGLLRIVRGATIATRGQLYVTAAAMSGLRTTPILRRHILPRLAGPIIVQTSLFCAGALIAESGLSFLGLTRPDAAGPSWGNMVAEAASNLYRDPWLLVPSGGIIALTVLAFSLFGDAVRDATVDVAAVPHPRRAPRPAGVNPAPRRTACSSSAISPSNSVITALLSRSLTMSRSPWQRAKRSGSWASLAAARASPPGPSSGCCRTADGSAADRCSSTGPSSPGSASGSCPGCAAPGSRWSPRTRSTASTPPARSAASSAR
jgi:peptide/nickel transport system permease protein